MKYVDHRAPLNHTSDSVVINTNSFRLYPSPHYIITLNTCSYTTKFSLITRIADSKKGYTVVEYRTKLKSGLLKIISKLLLQ